MSKWHGGKGSVQRPVEKEKFDKNWDRIFGKKDLPSAVDDAAKAMEESAAKRKADKDAE